ncbi:MAG: radical SAM protein [Candidatus Verstraetearchaeota archaeon]|nr:radical SAM protein [Candidatus Verstraetearchaeota archaeon]
MENSLVFLSFFADSLSAKANAPELLEKELSIRARKREYGIMCIASQEGYIPIEKEVKMTRRLLEIILRYRFPVHNGTKSTLILRDLDLLKEIDRSAILPEDLRQKLGRGVIISFSFSTLDEGLAKIFETKAPTPRERLETMRECKREGFLVGANLIPVLPFLSDSDERLEEMIKAAKGYGADFVLVGSLTLYGEGKELFYRMLERHFPEFVPRYKSLFGIFLHHQGNIKGN